MIQCLKKQAGTCMERGKKGHSDPRIIELMDAG